MKTVYKLLACLAVIGILLNPSSWVLAQAETMTIGLVGGHTATLPIGQTIIMAAGEVVSGVVLSAAPEAVLASIALTFGVHMSNAMQILLEGPRSMTIDGIRYMIDAWGRTTVTVVDQGAVRRTTSGNNGSDRKMVVISSNPATKLSYVTWLRTFLNAQVYAYSTCSQAMGYGDTHVSAVIYDIGDYNEREQSCLTSIRSTWPRAQVVVITSNRHLYNYGIDGTTTLYNQGGLRNALIGALQP